MTCSVKSADKRLWHTILVDLYDIGKFVWKSGRENFLFIKSSFSDILNFFFVTIVNSTSGVFILLREVKRETRPGLLGFDAIGDFSNRRIVFESFFLYSRRFTAC